MLLQLERSRCWQKNASDNACKDQRGAIEREHVKSALKQPRGVLITALSFQR